MQRRGLVERCTLPQQGAAVGTTHVFRAQGEWRWNRCGSTRISAARETLQQTPVGSVASWRTASLNEEDWHEIAWIASGATAQRPEHQPVGRAYRTTPRDHYPPRTRQGRRATLRDAATGRRA